MSAGRTPDREALVTGSTRMTYRELDAAVNRTAAALATTGLTSGDRLVLMAANSAEFVVAFYAAAKLGAIIVPVNPRSAPPEIAHFLSDSGARVLCFAPQFAATVTAAVSDGGELTTLSLGPCTGYRDLLVMAESHTPEPPRVTVAEYDDALILYTSGTTGRPKGVLLDHHRVIWVGISTIVLTGLRDGDRFLHVAPLYHAAELTMMLIPGMMLGAAHVVLPGFEPATVLDTLERERINAFFGVPTMYQFLLRQDDLRRRDLSQWRVGIFGAAPMPSAAVEELVAALPGVRLVQACGQTEGGPGGIYSTPEEVHRRPDASGRSPLLNTEVRIVGASGGDIAPGQVGELLIRGETVMKGYWNQPEATAETVRDGWLHTGDLARLDPDGFITLVDRLKDLIITGGRNVYSIEVENAIAAHPDVADCAVVGRPHPEYGESIVALVSPRPGTEPTLAAIKDFAGELIAGYKLPHELLLGEVPRNASGKALKHEIRAMYEERGN
ncbi:AMP-binding protein [Actinomadura sp. KC345]|uniref:class I adenylate-forming enzyme family protein n=1 Tax=Actinomadura sp. KC345 TaxID=2530371 RepID=UPI001A9CCFD0|nr:AMP-binding protein [Actinomadura sp. KC345]